MDETRNECQLKATKMKVFVSFLILFIKFLGYFDSSAIEGIVPLLQENFNINDGQTAIIQTSTSITHSVVLGLVWIFGDSFGRRKLFITSVSFWIAFSLLAVLLGSNSYMVFVFFRSLGEAAESVFGILVQVILADLFQDRSLGVALMGVAACEFIAGRISSIVSSSIITNGFPWQTGLVIGPLLSIVPVIILCCTKKTLRSTQLPAGARNVRQIVTDAFNILSIKSFVLVTVALSFATAGAKTLFWLPSMFLEAWTSSPESFLGLSYTGVISLWSTTNIIGTVIGLPSAIWFAQSWYHATGLFSGRKEFHYAYPIVLSLGNTICTAMYIIGLLLVVRSFVGSLAAFFLNSLFAAAGSSLAQLILLTVVPSSSRAAAVALSKLVTGLVSGPSAQIIGMVSDAIRGDSTLPYDRFRSYQLALIYSTLFSVASIICDASLIIFYTGDYEKANQKEKDHDQESDDERTSLIEPSKGRSESILDAIVRSRATSLNI